MARKTLKGITSDYYNNLSFLYKLYYNFMCLFIKDYCKQANSYDDLLPANIWEDARQSAENAARRNADNEGVVVTKNLVKRSLRKNN